MRWSPWAIPDPSLWEESVLISTVRLIPTHLVDGMRRIHCTETDNYSPAYTNRPWNNRSPCGDQRRIESMRTSWWDEERGCLLSRPGAGNPSDRERDRERGRKHDSPSFSLDISLVPSHPFLLVANLIPRIPPGWSEVSSFLPLVIDIQLMTHAASLVLSLSPPPLFCLPSRSPDISTGSVPSKN